MWSAVFLIINWVLTTAFIARPFALADKIFYGGIAPVLTFPVFFAVIFDWPRDRPFAYQFLLIISIYCWSIYLLVFIYLCGFYSHRSHFTCGSKDFIGVF
jgi:osomolarity two-component system, sensor histidine kinase SLN1